VARHDRRWLPPLVLALPFVVGTVLLGGLTDELRTFHHTDARVYHLPTIVQFAGELPTPDLVRYPAAQTPAFHLVFAAYGKLVGLDIWKLQLLQVVISYLAALAVFRMLVARIGLNRGEALALTLLVVLSPYVLGPSFILMTDSLALLLGILALDRFFAFGAQPRLGVFLAGCGAMAGALLTRQAFVWLVPVAAWALLRSGLPARLKGVGTAAIGAALAPLLALFVAWGGLVPRGADPTSCGLCPTRAGAAESSLSLRATLFTLALVGMYAAAVHGPRLLRGLREWRRAAGATGAAALGGVAVLVAAPLAYSEPVSGVSGDAGYLWKLSDRAPLALESSLLFWALVPLGAVAAWLLARRAGRLSLPVVYLVAFLVAQLPVRLVYQKYFDPFALLAVALLARPGDLRRPWDYVGIVIVMVASIAYALSFEI